MSLVDRINRLLLKRIGRNNIDNRIVGDTLRIGDTHFALTELTAAVAYETNVHAGMLINLTLNFGPRGTVTVSEDDACWPDLLAALDRLGLTGTPSRAWTTAILAAGVEGQPIVLRRDERPEL